MNYLINIVNTRTRNKLQRTFGLEKKKLCLRNSIKTFQINFLELLVNIYLFKKKEKKNIGKHNTT